MSEKGWGKWGSWEEAESFVGKTIGVTQSLDPVEIGAIRRWLEPKEFELDIYRDEAAAKANGYRNITAPASMIFSYGVAPYWTIEDGDSQPGYTPRQISIPVIFDVPAPCRLSFATSIEINFEHPIYVGDLITCTSKLISITKKELSVGAGAFFRQEDTYTNQSNEILAVSYLDIFRFNPPGESS